MIEAPSHPPLDLNQCGLLDSDDQQFRLGGKNEVPQVPVPLPFGLPPAELVENEDIDAGTQVRHPCAQFLDGRCVDRVPDGLTGGKGEEAAVREHMQRVVSRSPVRLVALARQRDESVDEAELRRGPGKASQAGRLARSDRSGDGQEKHGR